MKAVVFDGRLRLVDDYPVPVPDRGEALVKVLVAGICRTDLEILRGYMSFSGVPGHEFVGIVEEVNGEWEEWVGKRVVGEINCACGVCEYCSKGLKTHCPSRKVLGIHGRDGAFAEYVAVPVTNLHEVPAHLANEEAVFTEPLAAAFEIVEQVKVKRDWKIVVLGDGKLGILCAMVLKLYCEDVLLVGKHPGKMKVAESLGVPPCSLSDFKGEKIYDLVVEATGRADGFGLALEVVKPRGVVVLKTTVAESRKINLSPLVIDEVTVVGSRCGPFHVAIEALASGKINVTSLISHRFPITNITRAFECATDPESLKVLVIMGS